MNTQYLIKLLIGILAVILVFNFIGSLMAELAMNVGRAIAGAGG